MIDISPRVDKDAIAFGITQSVVELAKAIDGDSQRGHGILIGLSFAPADLTKIVGDRDDDLAHAEMVVRIVTNIAQPDGVHAIKAAKALGL